MSEAADIVAAARAAEQDTPHLLARRWMLETHVGTLCTTLARRGVEGFPYGSVTPFAVDGRGRPYILIANIATHTANLKQDARGALFVRQPDTEGDPQAGWRVTYIGRWAEVDRDDLEWPELHARYVERVPAAHGYLETHGFQYWRLDELETVRFIGGFGKITWLKGERCLRDPHGGGLDEVVAGAIQHMNDDHAGNMVEMVRGLYGVDVQEARMTAMDRAGFFVETDGPKGLYHFSFGYEIDARSLRKAVVDVLKRARKA